MGIIACGVQGKSNLEALSCLFSIKEVKVFDVNLEIAERFVVEMGEKLSLKLTKVKKVKDAVLDMGIVVTAGPISKNPTPIIEDKWFSEGAFASPVDLDSYWSGSVLKNSNKIITDDINQMEYFRKLGYFKETPLPYAELGEIVIGGKPGRENDKERIISINIGLALEDIAVAAIIYRMAVGLGIGTYLML